jgi:hypothetical protein
MRKRGAGNGPTGCSRKITPARRHLFATVWAVAAVLALVASPPAAAQVVSGVHIISGPTVTKISGSSVTVTWTTDKAKAGQVKVGDKKGHYSKILSETAPTANHAVTVTGLGRKSTYHYKVKTGSAASKDGVFTTADYDDAPFTFANVGDNRGDAVADDTQHVTPGFQNVLNAATAKAPAFTVHVGDMFIGDTTLANTQSMYDVFKQAIQPLIAASAFTQYPFTVSPGNHEMRPACASTDPVASCTPAFDPFALFNQELPDQPQNGPAGYVGTTFSFDYGNTHVASIDGCRFDATATTSDWDLYDLHDAVIDWLDADLTAAQQAHVRHIFVFGHPEAWAPDGLRWTVGSSGSQADLYAEVNRLAVGSGGTILTSQDGVTWTPQVSGTTATLRAVTVGPVYAAVGDGGTILTCPLTGSTWTPAVSGTTRQLNGVYSNGTGFVAVGEAGTILTSEDGVAWHAASSGTGQDLACITQASIPGHKMYVAVGKGGTLLTSHDANTWTAQSSGTTEDLNGVTGGWTYGVPLIVAVGAGGTVLSSPDSVTWTIGSSGVSADLYAVASTHVYIAVGAGGAVVTSEDGVQWDAQQSGLSSDILGLGMWNPDELQAAEYIAVGAGGGLTTSPQWLGVASLGNYKSQRDKLWQVLKNHQVDVYLCGHVHIFDDSFTVDGVVQWLDGISGCHSVGNNRWTLWSIDGDTATAQLLDESGNVTHTRVIQSSQP